MPTIDNTKRRFRVSIMTKLGVPYESKLQHTYQDVSNYWVNLEKDKCLKFPVSSTQYVLVSCDIIACIIVDEMLLDKLNSESILTSN